MRVLTVMGITAVVAVGVIVAVVRAMDAAQVALPRTNVDIARGLSTKLEGLRARGRGEESVRVVYLGDSTAQATPQERSIPARLQAELAREKSPRSVFDVRLVAHPGLWSLDFYFLAEEITGATPDVVVVTFNPASTSQVWLQRATHPELAGWMPAARLPQALRLPLERFGLRADQLLLYRTLVGFGLDGLWGTVRAQQARVGEAWQALALALQGGFASSAGPGGVPEGGRKLPALERLLEPSTAKTRRAQQRRYGVFLESMSEADPVVEILGAAVARFTAAGARILVFVLPVNLELFEEVGILDRAKLAVSLANLRVVVERNGGVLLDLHGQLPAAGFSDRQGHLAHDASVDAPAVVAAEIARSVRRLAPAAGEARR